MLTKFYSNQTVAAANYYKTKVCSPSKIGKIRQSTSRGSGVSTPVAKSRNAQLIAKAKTMKGIAAEKSISDESFNNISEVHLEATTVQVPTKFTSRASMMKNKPNPSTSGKRKANFPTARPSKKSELSKTKEINPSDFWTRAEETPIKAKRDLLRDSMNLDADSVLKMLRTSSRVHDYSSGVTDSEVEKIDEVKPTPAPTKWEPAFTYEELNKDDRIMSRRETLMSPDLSIISSKNEFDAANDTVGDQTGKQ